MTSNQLRYWQNVETERSNKAREKETNRSNLANEKETNRSNLAREKETNRHNLAIEALTSQSNAEIQRHNAATEAAEANKLAFNYANLSETNRANLANEAAKAANIQLGYANLGLGYGQLQEQIRSHQANEKQAIMDLNALNIYRDEQNRMTQEQNEERARHNVATEEQDRLNWLTGRSNYGESAQHNQATESLAEKEQPHKIMQGYIVSGAQAARSGASYLH